jgi:hypothetical protein
METNLNKQPSNISLMSLIFWCFNVLNINLLFIYLSQIAHKNGLLGMEMNYIY